MGLEPAGQPDRRPESLLALCGVQSPGPDPLVMLWSLAWPLRGGRQWSEPVDLPEAKCYSGWVGGGAAGKVDICPFETLLPGIPCSLFWLKGTGQPQVAMGALGWV